MIIFAGVGDIKHIDGKQDIFCIEIRVKPAACPGCGAVTGDSLLTDEVQGTVAHSFFRPLGDVRLFLVKAVSREACQITHVKGLDLALVKGLE